jgi:hypothetical protein
MEVRRRAIATRRNTNHWPHAPKVRRGMFSGAQLTSVISSSHRRPVVVSLRRRPAAQLSPPTSTCLWLPSSYPCALCSWPDWSPTTNLLRYKLLPRCLEPNDIFFDNL